ncbi:linear amide C-N hydrolase [Ruegeria jejuensis]|uniref:linear amide C-N hydrolase n=1 Tax=Ruegeria jejuensis TaxID=3233338 RepID=UPI00355BDCE0
MSGLIAALFSVTILTPAALACTGVTLTGGDGSVVFGRTLEWGPFDLKGRLDIIPRGHAFESEEMPDGSAGMAWTGKYGVVGISILDKTALTDGINEVGLSGGMFYLPGFSEYKDYDPGQADVSLSPPDVLGYMLSQFQSIEEVRNAFAEIRVVSVVEEALGFPAPMHLIFTEPSGNSIVVEFDSKEVQIFDAPLGVITNAPTYDWHTTNLRNYVNLSPVSVPPKTIDGEQFSALGAGSGMIGLPGDFTPPSRFVRAVAFSTTARPTTGGYDTVRETFRILDNFNVPLGAAEGADDAPALDDLLYSATQYTTAIDTKNHVFYYHTQFSRRVRMVDLKQIDFAEIGDEVIIRPLDDTTEEDIVDLTPSK